MTAVEQNEKGVWLNLDRAEALVLFEWLSRNWERTQWKNEDLFADPAEKQLLIWLEADLESVLAEPFDANYNEIISRSRRTIVPDPKEWE